MVKYSYSLCLNTDTEVSPTERFDLTIKVILQFIHPNITVKFPIYPFILEYPSFIIYPFILFYPFILNYSFIPILSIHSSWFIQLSLSLHSSLYPRHLIYPYIHSIHPLVIIYSSILIYSCITDIHSSYCIHIEPIQVYL